MFSTTPAAREALLAEFPELAEYGQRAVRLHPRPGSPGVRESSVGGPLLWPAGEAWPVCAEQHAGGTAHFGHPDHVEARLPEPVDAGRPGYSGHPEQQPAHPGPAESRAVMREKRRARFAALGVTLPGGLARGPQPAGESAGDASGPSAADAVPAPVSEPAVMAPVLQLYRRDAPALPFPEGADLLQLVWCPAGHAERLPALPRIFWRSAAAIEGPPASAPQLNQVAGGSYVPQACAVHPEEIVEYPPVSLLDGDPEQGLFGLLPAELETRIRRWDRNRPEGYTYDLLAHAPGWKAGGWDWSAPEPYALVPCGCGAPMRPLLETFVNEQLHGPWAPDGIPGFRWGDPAERRDQEPTGVSIALNGATWVRICTADPYHPLNYGLF